MRIPNTLPFVTVALLVTLAPLSAQVDRATLSGTVTDPSGSVIPGVRVEAISLTTSLLRTTSTGVFGSYQIPGLPIGAYKVTVSKEGFKPLVFENVSLSAGDARTLDARLQVGAISEQVTVEAAPELVNRSSAEVGAVIESSQIHEIPLNGRAFATLMMLAPGAINAGGGTERDIRFNGRSRDDNNFTFDGIDASGIQEQPQKAEARLQISLESVAEFRVNTSTYTAESGATAGGQINVVSKSGTNALHGSAFDYLRNNAVDARSIFDGAAIPPFHMNQFGASLGGPVVKDKAFFFANYEGIRQHLGSTSIINVPSAALRAQVLAKSPALQPIVNAWPVGTTAVDANTSLFTTALVTSLQEDAGMFRFDYRWNDRTTSFIRYSIDKVDSVVPDATGTIGNTTNQPQNLVLQTQYVFSPTLLGEFRAGINRVPYEHPTYGVVPVSISTPGFAGLASNALDEEVGTTFSYIGSLSKALGRHTIKGGVDIRRIRLNNSGNAIDNASVSYATLNGFINNQVDSISDNAAEGIHGLRRTFYMGYIQDEFKATPNLTFNVGLRYEYYSVASEVLGRSVVVDIAGCRGVCPAGTDWYAPNRKDFGPRIGLAWAPKALHGKTVIRSGFGMYFGGNQNDDFSDPMESTALRLALSSSDVPGLSFPITPFVSKFKDQGLSPKTIARDRKDSYQENWNLAVQQQLPAGFVAQLGYVGSAGHHLFTRYTINRLDPVTKTRPLASFGAFGLKTNDGNSVFDALQLSVQRRFSKGFLWQMQYMWSHAITDSSVGAGESTAFQNQSCRACDRSSAQFDVRHTMTTSAVYQLPGSGRILGGWEVSSLATARTGLPVNITLSRSAANLPDGFTSGQRPDYVAGQSIYAATPGIYGWFNPAAFATPSKNTWGNLGRYIANGPGYYEIDFGLQKRIPLWERKTLSIRAEAFNLFNHPILGLPSGNSSSGTFGRITSILNTGATGTGTPRRIQFMARFEF